MFELARRHRDLIPRHRFASHTCWTDTLAQLPTVSTIKYKS
jgi:hypothetical protein